MVNLLNIFKWRRSKKFVAKPPPAAMQSRFNDRQKLVTGFPLYEYPIVNILIIGAGALGSYIAHGLRMKGAGHFIVMDDDEIEFSNLTRQLYSPKDVGKYKAHVLGKDLTADPLFPLDVIAHPKRFQELYPTKESKPDFVCDVLLCLVDNNPTRKAVAAFAHHNRIPAIFTAVGRDANALTVSVQLPGQACWGCLHPHLLTDESYPCNLPATNDVIAAAAGFTLHAVDSVIGTRPREWNSRIAYLDGGLPDRTTFTNLNPDCPICEQKHQSQPSDHHDHQVKTHKETCHD
jgi:molybdopterin/thiamine biosynthesis adenylyltransferase